MDSILTEKIDAIKKSKNKNQLLLQSIIKLMLSVFSIGLFLLSPDWVPFIISIIKKIETNAFGPKELFIVCNIIILILIRDSKLSKSFMQPDIHQEYVNSNRNFQKMSGRRYNDDEPNTNFVKRNRAIEEENDDVDNDEDEGYEEVEELNKRAEDFIARVNKQRKLEAQLKDCYS